MTIRAQYGYLKRNSAADYVVSAHNDYDAYEVLNAHHLWDEMTPDEAEFAHTLLMEKITGQFAPGYTDIPSPAHRGWRELTDEEEDLAEDRAGCREPKKHDDREDIPRPPY